MTKDFLVGFIDNYNTLVGGIVAVLSALFGDWWVLFAGFLLFNLLDYCTGWYKARKLKAENSRAGWIGAAKKVLYWVMVLVAFVVAGVFYTVFQKMLGIKMEWIYMLGWFTLATLFVNEARSILENLCAVGINIPNFLIKGLAITQKLLEDKAANFMPEEQEEERP